MTTLPSRAAAVVATAALSLAATPDSQASQVVYTFTRLLNGHPGTDGTGTHPNLAGITSFHVPALTSALVRAGGLDPAL